jgi:FKBP12-rapamycin complex-associated protein
MVMNRANANAATEARREASLGQMRCLAALAEWEALGQLCAREWELSAGIGPAGAGGVGAGGDAILRGQMAPLATQAAWHLGDWSRMEVYSEAVAEGGIGGGGGGGGGTRGGRAVRHNLQGVIGIGGGGSGAKGAGGLAFNGGSGSAIGLATDVDFFRAVLAVHRGETDAARTHIASARDALGAELAALVTESYDRSYGGMIRVQQLTELEEVIEYAELGRQAAAGQNGHHGGGGGYGLSVSEAGAAATRRELMRQMWRERIYGVQRNVEVWQALLAVRSLVLPMGEETGTWLKFASLNRKAGRTRQAHRTLLRLLNYDPSQCAPGGAGYGAGSGRPDVMLAYVKHQWALGNRRDAFARLQSLVGELRWGRSHLFLSVSSSFFSIFLFSSVFLLLLPPPPPPCPPCPPCSALPSAPPRQE